MYRAGCPLHSLLPVYRNLEVVPEWGCSLSALRDSRSNLIKPSGQLMRVKILTQWTG